MVSLFELSMQAIVSLVEQDAEKRRVILNLPSDVLQSVATALSPISLELLQAEADRNLRGEMPIEDKAQKENGSLKRSYSEMAQNAPLPWWNDVWKHKVETLWPQKKDRCGGILSASERRLLGIGDDKDDVSAMDWRARFWESHLQQCFNEAAARASTPAYRGPFGNLALPDYLLQQVGFKVCGSNPSLPCVYNLKYVCQQFGKHIRYLRLRGVLCTKELSDLLSCARLKHVTFTNVATAGQVEVLCGLLMQSKECLQVLRFHHCKFSHMMMPTIYNSLMGGGHRHQLLHLFILSSSNMFQDEEAPLYFSRFVNAGSHLQSIVLVDNQISWLTASKLFSAIFEVSQLLLLRVTENELQGFLKRDSYYTTPFLCSKNFEYQKHCVPLRVLDLGSNKLGLDDIEDILPCLKCMHNLHHLNLSDNPIGDGGLRALLPILRELPLTELDLSASNISSMGACLLLEVLSLKNLPLHFLNLSQNPLGRSVATSLADFLKHGIVERLDIQDISLGITGGSDLQAALTELPELAHLVISKNRLGSSGSALICKLIASSRALKVLDCSSNLLGLDCMRTIAAQLKSKYEGMLETLDLRHNLVPEAREIFRDINLQQKPAVLVSNLVVYPLSHLHDDDP